MKKESKKISPIPVKKNALKNMSHDDFGAILEHIEGMFTTMVEGLYIANERGNRIEGRIDGLETEMRSSFKTVMEYLTRIDTEIQEIKAELSQKAQIKEVKELQNRVLKLELELISIRNSLKLQKA